MAFYLFMDEKVNEKGKMVAVKIANEIELVEKISKKKKVFS